MRVGTEVKNKVLAALQADLIEQEEMLSDKLKLHKANSDSDSNSSELNEQLIDLSNEYITNRDKIIKNYPKEPEQSAKLNQLKANYDKQKQEIIYGNA
jgi:hypothetical protein